MNEIDTNTTETKGTGIGRYFAGKTIPQIIFGSAAWACILGYVLFSIGQISMLCSRRTGRSLRHTEQD